MNSTPVLSNPNLGQREDHSVLSSANNTQSNKTSPLSSPLFSTPLLSSLHLFRSSPLVSLLLSFPILSSPPFPLLFYSFISSPLLCSPPSSFLSPPLPSSPLLSLPPPLPSFSLLSICFFLLKDGLSKLGKVKQRAVFWLADPGGPAFTLPHPRVIRYI